MAMPSYRIANRIADLDAAQWDAVAGADPLLCHRWQRIVETHHRDLRPLYVLLQDAQGPLAAVVGNRPRHFGRPGWRQGMVARLTLMLGAPFAPRRSGIALRRGAALNDVLVDIARVFDRVGQREGRLLQGVSNVDPEDVAAWIAQGYRAEPRPPCMVLDLPGADYDTYLAALSAKNRAELRRFRRRGEAHAVSFTWGWEDADLAELHPLLVEVYARHGDAGAGSPVIGRFLPEVARSMTDRAVLLRGFVAGQLAGFCLFLGGDDAVEWPLCGLNYELAHPSCLYFLMLDEAVRWAIACGYRRMYAGQTNEAQKARQGFRAEPRWFCYGLRPRLVGRIVGAAMSTRFGAAGADWARG